MDSEITALFSKVEALTENEKRAFADFERRISILNDHKVLTRKIFLRLHELYSNQNDERARGDLLMLLSGLKKTLSASFYSLSLTDETKSMPKCEISEIEAEIIMARKDYEMMKDAKMNSIASEKTILELEKLLLAEDGERTLFQKFQERLDSFVGILEAEKRHISDEIGLIDEMTDAVSRGNIAGSVGAWHTRLKNHQEEIDRLLRTEKELIQEPLDALYRESRRATRLALDIISKNKVTAEDVRKDLATFTKPEEVNFYKSKLMKPGFLGRITDSKERAKIEQLLGKLDYAAGLSSEKKSKTLSFLQRIAYLDPLTGLYTRMYLKKEFNRLKEFAGRSMGRSKLTLLMMDIDKFKLFNDVYGHPIGDAVLQKVASIIKTEVKREGDVVSRFGGEEFVVLVATETKSQAIAIAENIRKAMESDSYSFMARINEGKELAGERKNITISIGLATYPDEGQDFSSLYDVADARLYKAKEGGRNRVFSE